MFQEKSNGIELFLPFYYLLAQYKIGPISLGAAGLIIVTIISLYKNKNEIILPSYYRGFIFFLFYAVIRDIIKIFSGNEFAQTQINKIAEYSVIFIAVLIICNRTANEGKLFRAWKFAGLIYIAGLAYHILLIHIMGKGVQPISIIPGYSLAAEGIISDRPCSFFSEPAAFVNAMIPLEFMALKRNNIKWALITTISILASTSTVGIILSVVLWGAFFFSKNTGGKYRFGIIVASSILIVGFLSLDIFADSFKKAQGILGGGGTIGSRIIMGFEIISTQSPLSLIFGTNYNEAFNYVTDHLSAFSSTTTYIYWSTGYVFLNTLTHLIFSYGIVGLILFLNPMIARIKEKRYKARPYIIMNLVALFGQSMLLNSAYFNMLIIILLYSADTYEIDYIEETFSAMIVS